MKEEVVVLAAEKRWVFKNGEFTDIIKGKKPFISRVNLDREPQYAAIFIKGEGEFRVIAEIDYTKSKLKRGEIWLKNPILVRIPIRFGKDKLQGIRYTTFKKIITHETTDYL